MSATTISADQWLEAAMHRRSVYALKNTSALSDSRVKDILEKVLSFSPSSFNSQPVRLTLITGEKHKQFWDKIIATAAPILQGVSEHVWQTMRGNFEGHKAAYGSVVFWERGNTIKESAEQHPSVAHMFPQFGDHATGMAQILVWTALELEGLGANLQHMHCIPSVEATIKEFCGVSEDYSLKAHLNYGDEAAEHPAMPDKLPTGKTLKVIK